MVAVFCVAQLAICDPCAGEFSAANFKQVWAQEFSQMPAAQPQAAPHPAVARIVVPEGEATSFGSGTLVDVRDGFGIVITNWHVVRDAKAPIEVIFPGGFTSKARALKMDADWDLAALVVWRPPVEPVKIAAAAPQPGDQLTICGYGPGIYRAATGRCTQYYAPREDFPQQMVELSAEARQGDSGGPIFNSRGELAGVLFGAGNGTTLGSFSGRVGEFLATLAPDIGCETGTTLVSMQNPTYPADSQIAPTSGEWRSSASPPIEKKSAGSTALLEPPAFDELNKSNVERARFPGDSGQGMAAHVLDQASIPGTGAPHQPDMFEKIKSALAAFGLFAIVVMFLKAAG
jgi:hypothetical protein